MSVCTLAGVWVHAPRGRIPHPRHFALRRTFGNNSPRPLRKNPADSVRRRAVFLDRDGTLMEAVVYCRDPAHVRVFPGVSEALIKLREAGFLICIVTNQSGIGQGLLTEKDFHRVQAELFRQLAPARVDAVYFCPDHPNDPSPRRKPGIGMLLEAARDLSIELSESYFVGDRDIDMECGRKAGTHTVLVETGYGRETVCRAEFRAPSMVEAAELIVKLAR